MHIRIDFCKDYPLDQVFLHILDKGDFVIKARNTKLILAPLPDVSR